MTYIRDDTKKKRDAAAHAQAILGRVKHHTYTERVYRCHVCTDSGMVELEPGARATLQSGASITVPESGPGVFSKCKGMNGAGCRYRGWRREEAAKTRASDGKPGSGEGAAL